MCPEFKKLCPGERGLFNKCVPLLYLAQAYLERAHSLQCGPGEPCIQYANIPTLHQQQNRVGVCMVDDDGAMFYSVTTPNSCGLRPLESSNVFMHSLYIVLSELSSCVCLCATFTHNYNNTLLSTDAQHLPFDTLAILLISSLP